MLSSGTTCSPGLLTTDLLSFAPYDPLSLWVNVASEGRSSVLPCPHAICPRAAEIPPLANGPFSSYWVKWYQLAKWITMAPKSVETGSIQLEPTLEIWARLWMLQEGSTQFKVSLITQKKGDRCQLYLFFLFLLLKPSTFPRRECVPWNTWSFGLVQF